MNSYLQITPVENCRTFVAYEAMKTGLLLGSNFQWKHDRARSRRTLIMDQPRLYNFGSAPGCNADGNKITIRLNGGEAVEVKIPMNHPSNELFLSIGVDMQDSYEINRLNILDIYEKYIHRNHIDDFKCQCSCSNTIGDSVKPSRGP